MKIKDLKRKGIILSLTLILAGALVSAGAYGLFGFDYNNLKESAMKDAWYQTIHINSNGNLWYGLEFGNDLHVITIGNSD